MGTLALGLELCDKGLGVGLVRVVEGLNGASADVADGPDHPHAGFLLGLGPSFGHFPARAGLFIDVQSSRFGRLGGGSQFVAVEGAASHKILASSRAEI